MSNVPSYFIDFLRNIRITESQVQDCKNGHSTLRDRLLKDEDLKDIVVATFLQGSYRRSTAIRPFEDRRKSDVDIIIVTNLDRNKITPREALERFRPFLEKHYKGKYKPQGRSWGIELSYVQLDLVPTSAPSEALKQLVKSASVSTDQTLEEARDWRLSLSWRSGKSLGAILEKAGDEQWRNEPLWIPDREAQEWHKTHPLAQIEATQRKNAACNGYYLDVVKCLKWWRTTQRREPKYPKSYPLEHLCCINCADGIQSVAAGVVSALEGIRDVYRTDVEQKRTPRVPDHGVPEHNVLGRVSPDDFVAFHEHITEAAELARRAYNEEDLHESVILWRQLFGDRFPDPPAKKDDGNGESPDKPGGYTPRKNVSIIGGGRFA
ncbi:MAG: nucleotidyltransferase [bacterium]